MRKFDEIDERAKEMLTKARVHIDAAIDEVRTQLDTLKVDGKLDLAELQTRAEQELREIRSRVAAFIDPDRGPRGGSEPPPPPPPTPEPGPDGEAEMGHS